MQALPKSMKSIISPWDILLARRLRSALENKVTSNLPREARAVSAPKRDFCAWLRMTATDKAARSEAANVLFSRTRQNSHALWLSKVLSRSTATLGSHCFSRRYWGPGRSKGQEEGRKSEIVNLTLKNTTYWPTAAKALGTRWCLSWGSGYPKWKSKGFFFPQVFHILVYSIIRFIF